ncbi:MAG TPA: L,D-transpeptidase family protein [Terriglobales bacterium]|nr:L,D-transpeptidase family protein [Terriglobales bacterium]
MKRLSPLVLGIAALLISAGSAAARPNEWSESSFQNKPEAGKPHLARRSTDLKMAKTVIGRPTFYEAREKDTFLDIARYYSLGHNEISDANPGVDEWLPPAGQALLLPTEYILPETEFTGVRVNIPEMRLYYFQPFGENAAMVVTYPVGLGRDEWRTPEGKFKVRGKTFNPTWVLPESIKAEHRRMGKPAPDFIAGGAPDNPLGKHRIELTLPMYAIHGTNIPWGVGMQVSHGCVRLYPEDIERLFELIPVGVPGEFLYQPVKVGARDGRVFIEVHKDIYTLKPGLYQEAVRLIDKYGWRGRVDMQRVRQAVVEQSGVPIDVTIDGGSDLPEENLRDVRPRTALMQRPKSTTRRD